MKVIKFPDNFNKLDFLDKKNYLVSLLNNNNNIDSIINSLILNNMDIVENFSLLNSLKYNKVYKNEGKIDSIELNSKIINFYIKNNKTKELDKYFKTLNKSQINKIINYEIEHKTDFSKLKICKDLLEENRIKKSKKKVLIETKKSNTKKKKAIIIAVICIIFLTTFYLMFNYCYEKIRFYNNHIYPNIYLNDELISDKSDSDIIHLFNSKEATINENIVFKNENDTFTYNYVSIGYSTNKEELINKIIEENKKLNGYQKLSKIFFNNRVDYNFKYSLDENKYEEFINDLRSKVNVNKTNESFYISNGVINYKKGMNGFSLNEENIKEQIDNSLKENVREITLTGDVTKTNNTLGLINKKVSTFTTYYNEAQGRAVNIKNAVKKLNGKIIYSDEVFSFYKTVGPYNGSRGFIFYDKDVGSGVCQVSTTIYNAALLLNLPIVARENHGDMVYYVDYGMDATVYGSSVDMKFKNNSKYPIYVEAHASGGTLTVNLWSNENIVSPGYSYKPRVEHLGGLSYKTYLDTYYNGTFVSTKYLNSSYYVKGKH